MTRAIIRAIEKGNLKDAPVTHLSTLNLSIPKNVPGVEPGILNPRDTWRDADAYDRAAGRLASMFIDNFRRFEVDEEIIAAGPILD